MNKLGTKLGAVAMSAVMALTFAPSAAITSLAAGGDDLTDATQELSTPVYRLYNPNSGEHLFTTNENECDSLDKNGWDYETIAWYAPSVGDPVFRLYNPNHPLGDHHYTSSEEERDNLIKQGWKLDATAFNTVAEGELLGAPVYSLYNPNAYDLGMATHHLTLSEEEADGLELLGWTNEGPKFYEYAEDLDPEVEELTVSIDNTTPKVGDTLTAIPEGAAAATYQWLANGVEIPGATDATLKVKEDYIGQQISVTVTAEDGEEATSEETAPVTNDKSAEIKLVDRNGLQPDGTALATDILDVSYGADLGTPSVIIWYCNGAAKTVYSLSGGGIGPGAFNSVILKNSDGEIDAGNWWVTIENTAGQVSVTNVIAVASNNVAVMSDFSIEDNYETLVGGFTGTTTQLTTTPDEQIINVTFNKKYLGTLYLNEVDNETYTTAKMVGGIDLSDLKEVKKASKFTNKEALGYCATLTAPGIYYAESDGTVHAKIVVPAAVTRGTDYELIFDQEDVIGDELGAKAVKEDLNVTDSYASPYVIAPAEITVTSYSTGNTTPKVTMFDETGAVLEWWDDVDESAATVAGFDSMKFYSIDSNTASASDLAATTSNVAISEGVVTLTISAAANDYGYAKFATTKGIFAADSATLTSEVYEGAMAPMTNMTLAQDSSDPKAAKVSFKNLKGVASGTVYIFKNDASDPKNVKALSETATKKAVGSAVIEGGTTSVIIDKVFEAVDTDPGDGANNQFVATFVPDNTELFKTVYNGGDGDSTIVAPDFFTLKQSLTSFKLFGDKTANTAVAGKFVFTAADDYTIDATTATGAAFIAAYDQFGNGMKGDVAGVELKTMTFTQDKSTFAGDPPANTNGAKIKSTVATENANVLVIDQGALTWGQAVKKDNAFTVTLPTKQTLTLTITNEAANGLVKFKLGLS